MKTKICVLTILILLISTSFALAAMKSNALPSDRIRLSTRNTQYHPILETPPEDIYPIKSDGPGFRDPPEPDQDVYFLWEDNFEDEDAIWYYANASYFWVIPDEADEYGVRFTARRAGTLDGAYFYWYVGSTDPQAVVHVYADDGTGYPGTELGSVTVTATLPAWNYVDLTSLGLNVNTTDDFFITYSVVPGDTLAIISDDGPSGANRSVEILPDSLVWTYTIDDFGADYEWCIDAVIGVTPAPWASSPADRWLLVDDEYNSPTHSWWVDDNPAWPGMNWCTSPAFMCPDGYGQIELNFYYNSDFLDGAYPDDDWWSFYIGRTADAIAWHSSDYNAYLDSTSWYAGSEDTHTYGENAIYYLYTPDIDLTDASAAQLTCVIDYDMEELGAPYPDPFDGWDVANVQISTDGWATKGFLEDPANPYNVTISYAGHWNTGDPADLISYPGWGGPSPAGWFNATFDLVDYLGETIQIRFALASDPYTVAEGYWVDNLDIDVDGAIVFSDYDETNLIPADPIIPYQELEYSNTADELVSGGWVQSESYNITLYAGCEIVLAARARLDADTTLSLPKEDGAGLWFDDVAIYGSNLPPHDMANMFNVIPYPASVGVDLFPGPGIVYGNFGTTTEAPQLRMDVEGLGGGFDYYYNAAEAIETGEFGFEWMTKIPTFELEAGLKTFTGWTIVGSDADPTNDTLSIDIDVLPAGEYELGYNSRIWDGTYYTGTYCGSYFTPFSDGILDSYTINSVKTLLINYGTDFATDTETIEIYDAIDDTTLGALLYTEDFSYTAGAYGTYEWAVFNLTDPLTLYDDFFVLISGDWWTDPDNANYYPLFDNMVRQYLGSGAYSEHTVYFADPGWAHSSGDRFVNTLGTGDPHSVDPGTGNVEGSYLRQNSPNPFNNETVINYYIKGTASHNIVEIKIFNLLGQLVDTVEGKDGVAVWNSKDLSSGIYFYKLTVDDFSEVKKMVIIK